MIFPILTAGSRAKGRKVERVISRCPVGSCFMCTAPVRDRISKQEFTVSRFCFPFGSKNSSSGLAFVWQLLAPQRHWKRESTEKWIWEKEKRHIQTHIHTQITVNDMFRDDGDRVEEACLLFISMQQNGETRAFLLLLVTLFGMSFDCAFSVFFFFSWLNDNSITCNGHIHRRIWL